MQTPHHPTSADDVERHDLVTDLLSALPRYLHRGYSIAIEPFPTDEGMYAVLQDVQGTRLGLLERPIETDQAIRH